MLRQIIAKVFGDQIHDEPDTGAPVKTGGVARQTNPTAVTNGDRVNDFSDDVGRKVPWLYQVRDLAFTATASLTTGTAATLLGATSGAFNDLIHVSFANSSTVAASITLLEDGTLRKTIQVPASNTLPIDFTYPLLQYNANTVWTADMEDITGTTVTVDATFIRNV